MRAPDKVKEIGSLRRFASKTWHYEFKVLWLRPYSCFYHELSVQWKPRLSTFQWNLEYFLLIWKWPVSNYGTAQEAIFEFWWIQEF